MTRFRTLAWSAAVCTYLLIVLGAVVRITHSGLGCGDHWPLCNGHVFPPLDDIGTVIEWSHRLVAALVSTLVVALAIYDFVLNRPSARPPPVRPSFVAVALLVLQIALGAITVKLELPAWSIVLHLGTAMLLLATLLAAATTGQLRMPTRGTRHLIPVVFFTVLLGGLTANVGAAAACGGFPLCNGQVWITAGPLAWVQWIHRLLAYSLALGVFVWAWRMQSRASLSVLGLVVLQVALGATLVLAGLPRGVQAAHVAVGSAVWAALVLASLTGTAANTEAPGTAPRPRAAAGERPI